MSSGQNNTCGRGGNELEGMQKMCSAVHGPLKWMGSSRKNTAQLPSETPSSKRNDYPPANLDGMTLYSLDRNRYVHWFIPLYRKSVMLAVEPCAPQWELPHLNTLMGF